uniref:Probable 1-aminocyclopropane-1-carboxylate deaminase-like n=1 Tax=Saccoglossus kowalevskii TaxID=10224 RepID=A0ABM0GRG7_SACKO|nr:PREDICTED: probable 1-aminocyclopropane-1-carboxylate deaminase-like [Saccoglossus kowalevskii]
MSDPTVAKSFLRDWEAPEFAKKMKNVPKHRMEIRNLEFLLADAVVKGHKSVVTCGAFTSNHCRTTAVASAQLGLDAHICIRGGGEKVPMRGNLMLSRFSGATLYRLPDSISDSGFFDKMVELSKKLGTITGDEPYVIPVGGSSYPGLFGYVNCFAEMMQQGVLEKYTDIVITCGTAVTTGAIAISNYLTGSKLRIHSFSIKRPLSFIYGYVQECIDLAGLDGVKAEDLVSACVDYIGEGYGKNTEQELDFIRNAADTTGIVLDPVYTGKAARGAVEEMKNNPGRFKGKKVLFLHSGGVFSIYTDQRFDGVMTKEGSAANKVHYWLDLESEPPVGVTAKEQ